MAATTKAMPSEDGFVSTAALYLSGPYDRLCYRYVTDISLQPIWHIHVQPNSFDYSNSRLNIFSLFVSTIYDVNARWFMGLRISGGDRMSQHGPFWYLPRFNDVARSGHHSESTLFSSSLQRTLDHITVYAGHFTPCLFYPLGRHLHSFMYISSDTCIQSIPGLDSLEGLCSHAASNGYLGPVLILHQS